MNDKEFGCKIRHLREQYGFTREGFCGDESELSVRQLTRIEGGTCKPTLAKVGYIAGRFGITLSELMPDYVQLPERYTKLKYDILRTPTYEEEDLVGKREVYLTEIYDDYYDNLPEEERLAIDTLQSIFDVRETGLEAIGQSILSNHFQKVYNKNTYSINDLLIIRLFIEHVRLKEDSPKENEVLDKIVFTLCKQVEQMSPEELFVLRDVIFLTIGVLGDRNRYINFLELFASLEEIMKLTQDFQKKPILSMLRWKYELFVNANKEEAERHYNQAIIFAELISNSHLVEKLQKEWVEDCF